MKRERKNLVINFIKLLLTIAAFFVIFRRISFESLFSVFQNVRFIYLVIAFILGVIFTLLKTFKWYILVNSIEKISFWRALDSYFIGMSLGIITPGRIGELGRIANLKSKLEGIGIALWDKILDLYGVLFLSIIGVYYFCGIFYAALFLLLILFLFFLIFNPKHLIFLKKVPILKKYPQIIEGLTIIKKSIFIINLLVTILAYFLVILEGYILSRAFGTGTFVDLLYGYPLVMLVNLIPITIAGLGVREGTAIYLLGKLGIPSNIAFNISFLVFLFNTTLPALWGIVGMYLEEVKKGIYNSKVGVYLIMLIGGFLRFYKIGVRSIWIDEAITAQVSAQNLLGIIANRASTGIHPPLYFVMMHFWIKIFGDSEVAIRSFSAIWGILCIYMVYLVASKIFDRLTGIIASFLFALSPFYIYFAQEARMYPMVTFFVLFSIYNFLKGLENSKNLILVTISNIIAIYTHIFATFVVLVENMFVFITSFKNKKLLKKWLLFQLMTLLIFLPWLYVIIQNRTPEVYQGAQRISLRSLTYIFLELNLGVGLRIFNNKIFIILIFIGLFIIGLLPSWGEKRKFAFLLLFLFVPISLLLLFSLKKSFFSARYISIFIPGYFIILSRGVRKFKHYSLMMIVILGITIIYALSLNYYYNNLITLNRPWRDAVYYLHQKAKNEEKVFIFAPYMWRPFEYYNRGKIKYNTISLSQLNNLLERLEKGENFWLILANHEIEDPEGRLLNFINAKFVVLEEINYYRLVIKYLKVPES